MANYRIIELERENPRTWDTSIGIFIAFHNRYNLGDDHEYRKEWYTSWDELRTDIVRKEQPLIILPVHMYDHSSIAFSVGESFYGKGLPQGHAYFDSGMVGFVFTTREGIKELMGWTRITAERRRWIVQAMKEEIEDQYADYINGVPEYEFEAFYTDADGEEVSEFSESTFDSYSDAVDAAEAFLLLKTGEEGEEVEE